MIEIKQRKRRGRPVSCKPTRRPTCGLCGMGGRRRTGSRSASAARAHRLARRESCRPRCRRQVQPLSLAHRPLPCVLGDNCETSTCVARKALRTQEAEGLWSASCNPCKKKVETRLRRARLTTSLTKAELLLLPLPLRATKVGKHDAMRPSIKASHLNLPSSQTPSQNGADSLTAPPEVSPFFDGDRDRSRRQKQH